MTESPKGAKLAPEARKHGLWRAVEGGEGGEEKEEKFRDLEKWCLDLGQGERRKQLDDIENVFNMAVDKEMELRK